MTSKKFFSTITIFILLLFQNKVYATNNTKKTTTKTETKGTTVKSSQKTESTTKNSKINPKNKNTLFSEVYKKEKQVRAVVSIEYWLKNQHLK